MQPRNSTDRDALLNDMIHTLALSPQELARSRRSAEDSLRYVYITQERVHKSQDMLARSDRPIAQLQDLAHRAEWYERAIGIIMEPLACAPLL